MSKQDWEHYEGKPAPSQPEPSVPERTCPMCAKPVFEAVPQATAAEPLCKTCELPQSKWGAACESAARLSDAEIAEKLRIETIARHGEQCWPGTVYIEAALAERGRQDAGLNFQTIASDALWQRDQAESQVTALTAKVEELERALMERK